MKPLVFGKVTINDTRSNRTIETWELVPIGDSILLHAVWSPDSQSLICQYNITTESVRPFTVMKGKKEVEELRKVQDYFRINVSDLDAVEAILKNYVINYTDQEWKLSIPKIENPEGISALTESL